MTQKSSNKWILLRIVTPIAIAAMILSGCKDSENTDNEPDRTAFVVDSLLRENRRLTDSLDVVRGRLDDCENAHAKADSIENSQPKRCPCPCKPQPKPQPAPKKKPAPKKPVVVTPQPKDTVKTEPKQTTVVPTTQIIIGNQSENNGAIVVGNNNTTNNVVINGCTRVVLDTLNNVKTTRRIMSGYAQQTYSYTK